MKFLAGWCAACAVVVICGCDKQQEAAVEPLLRPVRVALVTDNGDVRRRTFAGVSQSTQESRMSFKVSGTVVEVPVQVGDQLKKGDLIASLNPYSYELAEQQAEASLAQAQANQRNAEADYNRVKELYENTNASRDDLDAARASAESAGAQVRSARKSLEIAELNRSYTRLNAAADCTVASVDVALNENVAAGEQVARTNCGAGIEISFGVPDSLIGGFTQKMPAQVRFNALTGRTYDGEVTEVGAASGAGAVTFPVVVTLREPGSAVRPSMAAEVTVAFVERKTNVQLIPAAAVVNDERGVFVYIAQPQGDGKAIIRRRSVETGELTADGIEITDGLVAGDHVVTAGTSVIRDQQIVLLPPG